MRCYCMLWGAKDGDEFITPAYIVRDYGPPKCRYKHYVASLSM